jgi:DNA-binding PadR family transcriptional regulator
MDVELLILAALEAREMYGREIQRAVELLSDNKRKLSAGALYTTIHRLEKKGVIDGRWGDDSETRQGARRRYYRITGAGARVIGDARRALTSSTKRLRPLMGDA